MVVREVRLDERERYNAVVAHPLQSWEWGEFKANTGAEVVRLGVLEKRNFVSGFQVSFHRVPKTSFAVGYLPRSPIPQEEVLQALLRIGGERRAILIKLEPEVEVDSGREAVASLAKDFDLRRGKDVFTPYTSRIDLTQSEHELLSAMKPKTRYNVRLAQKRGVVVGEDNSDAAFETYLRLTFATAKRARFFAHNEAYHRKMWEAMHGAGIAHLLTATWNEQMLVTWIVFVFKNVLYYPYGASSDEHRNLMASNLMMWEAMRLGKQLGCQTFDLWGALGPQPDPGDPWYGFHRFKEGYGGKLIEFVGAYDLVILPQFYSLFRFADDLRWKWLNLLSRFR